jgi:hypothetical protein
LQQIDEISGGGGFGCAGDFAVFFCCHAIKETAFARIEQFLQGFALALVEVAVEMIAPKTKKISIAILLSPI